MLGHELTTLQSLEEPVRIVLRFMKCLVAPTSVMESQAGQVEHHAEQCRIWGCMGIK